MNDDGGVLGRLPRSRPGTRSEKRTGAGGPAKRPPKAGPRPAKKTTKAASAASAPKVRRTPKAATPPPKPLPRERPQGRPAHSAPPPERGGDPVTDALRAGAKVAEGGAKLAGGLARELLRRFPRP